MLKPDQNERLTRVGPGTPMGQLMRRYWMPALLSWELEAGGDPVRLRLLGENLVAFRTEGGEIGILGDHCPHRGASLFLGRNEREGLTCVYHGWRFDVDGRCVDMPNEPTESSFRNRVRHTSYRTFERNGMIWIHMGDDDQVQAEVPDLPWNLVPESHQYISRRYQACNFAQALEGGIDHTHTGFLHRTSEPMVRSYVVQPDDPKHIVNRRVHHPRFETLERDYGVAIAAHREHGTELDDWHVTHFLMPFYTVIAGNDPGDGHAWVPMDDTHTITWTMTWHPDRSLTDEERGNLDEGRWLHPGPRDLLPPSTDPEGLWRPIGQRGNDWLMDRKAAQELRFAGIPGFWLADQAVQESMGPIYDRSRERLGTSDAGIIAVRRFWLNAVDVVERGGPPPGAGNPAGYHVYGANLTIPRGSTWHEYAETDLWPAIAS